MRQPQDPLRKDGIEGRKRRAWWPIYGFFMLVAAAGIAYATGPMLGEVTYNSVRPGLPREQWDLIMGIAIGFVLVLVFGAIYSFLAPKPITSKISNRDLERERKLVQAEILARKQRQKTVRQDLAKSRKQQEQDR